MTTLKNRKLDAIERALETRRKYAPSLPTAEQLLTEWNDNRFPRKSQRTELARWLGVEVAPRTLDRIHADLHPTEQVAA